MNKYDVSKSVLVTQLIEPIEHNVAPKVKTPISYGINDGKTESRRRVAKKLT